MAAIVSAGPLPGRLSTRTRFNDERSCLMTKVSSLISTGRSSHSVFLLATAPTSVGGHFFSVQECRLRPTLCQFLQLAHCRRYPASYLGGLPGEVSAGWYGLRNDG